MKAVKSCKLLIPLKSQNYNQGFKFRGGCNFVTIFNIVKKLQTNAAINTVIIRVRIITKILNYSGDCSFVTILIL